MTEHRKVLQAHIDGVEYQQPIAWCITHGSTGRGTSPLGEACHYSALRQCSGLTVPPIGVCEFSDGGLSHRWWVDVNE